MRRGILDKYYYENDYPRFSLAQLEKGRKLVRRCLDEEDALGEFLAGRLAESVVKRIEQRMLRRKGDMTNPLCEDDMTWAKEESEMIEQRDRRRYAVTDLVNHFSDEEMESEHLRLFSIQVSGWWEELREGIPFQKWDNKVAVWAPIYVKECMRAPNKKGTKKKYYNVSLLSVAGPTAGEEWDFTWSSGYLQNILRNIGIPKYEKHEADDLGGMWFTSFMKPRGRSMLFDHIHVSSSQSKTNKDLYKARVMGCNGLFKPFEGKSCRTCPIGRNKCPKSRLRTSYNRQRECIIEDEQGNKHMGFFRDSSSQVCFGCIVSGKGISE
jgi:hypothetical protein